jgi:hypothetical protein
MDLTNKPAGHDGLEDSPNIENGGRYASVEYRLMSERNLQIDQAFVRITKTVQLHAHAIHDREV